MLKMLKNQEFKNKKININDVYISFIIHTKQSKKSL